MAATALDRHNELAPRLMHELVHGTLGQGDGPEHMLVILASLAFGCIELSAQLEGDERQGRVAYFSAFVDLLAERLAAAQAEPHGHA